MDQRVLEHVCFSALEAVPFTEGPFPRLCSSFAIAIVIVVVIVIVLGPRAWASGEPEFASESWASVD